MKVLPAFIAALILCSCSDRSREAKVMDQSKEYLKDKTVVETRTETIQTPDGPVTTDVTTVEPFPYGTTELTPNELASIRERAKHAPRFIAFYTQTQANENWELEHLDVAFGVWVTDDNPKKLSAEKVLSVVGSAFGEYCAKHLNVRWVKVTDQYGTDYAITSRVKEVLAFPYSTVQERIESGEHTFMVPVFFSIKEMIESGEYRDIESSNSDGGERKWPRVICNLPEEGAYHRQCAD